MGAGRDRTRDPWICSQTRICCQTRYRLRYTTRLTQYAVLCKTFLEVNGGTYFKGSSSQHISSIGNEVGEVEESANWHQYILFVWFDSLCPNQQYFSPGLNQY